MSAVYTLFLLNHIINPLRQGLSVLSMKNSLERFVPFLRRPKPDFLSSNNNTLKKISPVLIPGIKHKGGDSGL